ncbi:MAG: FtsX-like permease family protein [Bacteroidota bacterium]
MWTKLAPHRPFLYSFLDDDFDRQYLKDVNFKTLFLTFSSLAIFIACLGLFGLATYTAELRTKEIGIRKVLGANVNSIVALLSKDFIILIGIAIVLATPAGMVQYGSLARELCVSDRDAFLDLHARGICGDCDSRPNYQPPGV